MSSELRSLCDDVASNSSGYLEWGNMWSKIWSKDKHEVKVSGVRKDRSCGVRISKRSGITGVMSE